VERWGLACINLLMSGGFIPTLDAKGHRTMKQRNAKFTIGEVVRHKVFPFRGVVFDVDPEYANTEEWWNSIPAEIRPSKDQPFYHLLAENYETEYVAYVSEQNLEHDESDAPLRNPQVYQIFDRAPSGQLKPKIILAH
jgi:heat shock protein HspQ